MTETKTTRTARRGRLFPEIQWSEEKKAQRQAETEEIYQRCKVVFACLQPELIKTHRNWYMAVEPDSGDYFIANDEEVVTKMAKEKHSHAKIHVFRINETGAYGTI